MQVCAGCKCPALCCTRGALTMCTLRYAWRGTNCTCPTVAVSLPMLCCQLDSRVELPKPAALSFCRRASGVGQPAKGRAESRCSEQAVPGGTYRHALYFAGQAASAGQPHVLLASRAREPRAGSVVCTPCMPTSGTRNEPLETSAAQATQSAPAACHLPPPPPSPPALPAWCPFPPPGSAPAPGSAGW